jgi:oxalate decarboxylase/phosphoglucose isomerase-like protein (cupin superfamily)
MAMKIVRACMLAGLVGLMPAAASAQSVSEQPKPATDITRAMLDAAAKIGAAVLKPGVSVSDRNIALADTGGYNVTVAYVTRPATKTMSGTVLSHDKITEIYYVLSGSGTQVTGMLVDGKKSAGSPQIGPGWSSTTPIANGRATTLGPGEMQIVPPGLGHVWTEIADGGITYMVIRIDPEHVLGLSK